MSSIVYLSLQWTSLWFFRLCSTLSVLSVPAPAQRIKKHIIQGTAFSLSRISTYFISHKYSGPGKNNKRFTLSAGLIDVHYGSKFTKTRLEIAFLRMRTHRTSIIWKRPQYPYIQVRTKAGCAIHRRVEVIISSNNGTFPMAARRQCR
jgi:hypothetical protein